MSNMFTEELLLAMHEPVCPVCALKRQRLDRALTFFLSEAVLDGRERAKVVASRGLCARHARLMQAHVDPLGQSIVYQAVMEQVNAELADPGEARTEWLDHPSCPFCASEAQNEREILDGFAKALAHDNVQQALPHASPLCLRHYRLLADRLDPASRPARVLREVTRARYATLTEDLAAFCRHADYRHADEMLPAGASDAWKRAAHVLSAADTPSKNRHD